MRDGDFLSNTTAMNAFVLGTLNCGPSLDAEAGYRSFGPPVNDFLQSVAEGAFPGKYNGPGEIPWPVGATDPAGVVALLLRLLEGVAGKVKRKRHPTDKPA